jgi:uncharacterized protein involved in outer membrane biogenesis
MRRWKKILIWTAVFFAVFSIVGFFVLPPIVKSVLTDKLSQAIHRPVTIKEIGINPYALSVTVRGFEIKEPSGPEVFVSFDELYVNLDSTSVFRRALILKEISLKKPYAKVVRNADGSYSFSDLLAKPAAEKKEAEKEKPSEPFQFSLNNIRIEGGAVDFDDGPNRTKHKVVDILVALPFVSNMAYRIDQYTEPVISATINGTPYALKGKTKPFADTRATTFDVKIKDFNIPFYLAYVPVEMNFKLVSGTLDTDLELSFSQSRDKNKPAPVLALKGDMALKNFVLDDKKGQPLVKLPALNVTIADAQPLVPTFHIAKIALTKPEVTVHRAKDGTMNLLAVLPGKKAKEQTTKAKEPDRKKASVREKTPKETAAKEAAPAAPELLAVDAVQIADGAIRFKDETPAQPVSVALTKMNVNVDHFSTKKENKANLNFAVNYDKKGTIAVTGPFGIDPLAAELAVKLSDIDIRTVQGYFNDKIRINVTSGGINAAGNVTVAHQGAKGLAAKYAGKLLISRFNAIDKVNAETFLKWKSLFFSDIRAGYNPLSIDIRQIALADFYVNLVINEDGTPNLMNILEKEGPAAQAAGTTAEKTETKKAAKAEAEKPKDRGETEKATPVKIGAITVQNGTIDFLDRHIKPNYSSHLTAIGGRVAGLSSLVEKPAEVELRGKFNEYAPLEITGRINPFPKNLLVDIKASFKDMDLSPVTPYSGRYVGYAIQKGKLSFDLKYLIAGKKLDSENRIFIDQLTLGDKVNSPDATKLPVGLAIALLRDRNGQINLDVPVTGSTDDPKFSIARLVIQVIVNLITKAVTAPFALLGSLFGGGEEMSYVEFDYGLTAIPDAGQKKIDNLVKALYERPSLKLDIEGHADTERDREGLKRYLIDRKMKARKLNDMIKKGQRAVPVDRVTIEPQEYEKYLTEVYKAESFPKPRNVIGLVKALPVPEMEKLLMTYTVVNESDLKLLASQRAAAVRDAILKSGKVDPPRVFVIEPKTLAPEKKEKAKDSRVDFKLK